MRTDGEFSLACDDAEIPTDGTNLVMKAAQVFRAASGWESGVHFELTKRIPSGAGLGGGSSDAVGALKALNALSGELLSPVELHQAAASVGSDCPLFLAKDAVIMRGRGERVTRLPDEIQRRFAGRRLALFKPPFGINTAWAYGRLAAESPGSYLPESDVEARLAQWLGETAGRPETLGFNSFMPVVATKMLSLKTFAKIIKARLGVTLHLSGSGSACFVWIEDDRMAEEFVAMTHEAWGEAAQIWVISCFGQS